MLKIYNLMEKLEYIEEVATLTQKEWGNKSYSEKQIKEKILTKISKIKSSFNNPNYCKLILLDDDKLVGFISIFPNDGNECLDLTPWYSTMFVKPCYRNKDYSKILNNAILEEAKKRGLKKLYLKTTLINYYEKFGAIYLKSLSSGENLYYFDLINENNISCSKCKYIKK